MRRPELILPYSLHYGVTKQFFRQGLKQTGDILLAEAGDASLSVTRRNQKARFSLTDEPGCVGVRIFHHDKQARRSVLGRLDESGSSRRPGKCVFKWFLTRWRSVLPELWKSLRWPASAYAHHLREHAASWLPFTKAGTQGQREWE